MLLMFSLVSMDVSNAAVTLNGTYNKGDQFCGWLNIANGPVVTQGNTVEVSFALSATANGGKDQALVGSTTGGFSIDIPSANSWTRADIMGPGGPFPFYFPVNQAGTSSTGALVRGTTYRITVSTNGGVLRAWLNGVGMRFSNATTGAYSTTGFSAGDPINTIGTFYSAVALQNSGNPEFQGTIYYTGVATSNLYGSTTTITPVSTFTTSVFDKFLLTPGTLLPSYSTITGATASTTKDSNGLYQTTFTAANSFYAGESISLPNGTSSFLNGGTATVFSATSTQFVIETTGLVSGSWGTGRGTAIQTGTFKDDTGISTFAWPYTAACESETAAPTSSMATISGTAATGQTLTSALIGVVGGTNTYAWQRATTLSGTYSPISGATSSTYVVASTDIGNFLKVVVTNNAIAYTSAATAQVEKLTPTLTWPTTSSTTYGSVYSPTAPTVTSSIPGTFLYSSATTAVIGVTGTNITTQFTAASIGSSVITTTFTPTDLTSYNTATSTQTITVGKATPLLTAIATQSATFASPGATVTLNPTTVIPGISGGFTYSFTTGGAVTSIVSNVLTFGNFGSTTVTVNFAATSPSATNYNNASETFTVSVGKATSTLNVIPDQSATYSPTGGTATLTPSASVGGAGTWGYTYTAGGAVASFSGNVLTFGKAGSTVVNANFTPTNLNYAAAAETFTVTVAKATPTLAVIPTQSATFGTSQITVTNPAVTPSAVAGTFAYSLSSGSSVSSISGNTINLAGAGTSTVTATFTPDSASFANYNSTSETFTVSVGKATPVIIFAPQSAPYLSQPVSLVLATSVVAGTFTYTSSDSLVASISGSLVVTIGKAGTATITASFTPTDGTNYEVTSKAMTFTVGAITPTLNWVVIQKAYADAPFTITAPTSNSGGTFTYTSLNPSVVTTSGSGGSTITILAKGSAQIRATLTPTDGNSFITTTIDTTINVLTATPTVATTPITLVFGASTSAVTAPTANTPGTFTYTSNDSSIVLTSGVRGEAITATGAGSTSITASFVPTDSANYLSTTAQISVSVSKANQGTLTVVASAGMSAVPLLLSYTGGSDSSTPATYSTSDSGCIISSTGSGLSASYYVTKSGVGGTCGVTANKTASNNYNAVTSAALQIQFAGEQSVVSTSSAPSTAKINDTYVAAAVMSAGAAIVTVSSSSSSVCSIVSGVVTFIGQGICTINFSNPGTSLFQPSSFTQNVVVTTATQTISFPHIANQNYLGNSITASASSTSGLALSYSSTSDVRTCAITTSGVISIGALLGTCIVTANQSGNLIYSAALSVSDTFSVIATLPTAPRIASVTPWDTTVTLSWVAPTSNGGASISNYFVTTYQGDTSTVQTCSSNTTGCTVTGLTNGLPYTFAVTATNSVGNGPASPRSQVFTPAGKADAVHSLTVTPQSHSLTATWSAIDTATMLNGGIFQSFNIYISTDSSNLGVPIVDSSTVTTSHTFTGLTNGLTYYVRVITVTSNNSAAILGQTADSSYALPSAPSSSPTLTLINSVAGTITAVWTAPSPDGGDALTFSTGATVNGTASTCSYTAPYNTCTISNLAAGDVVSVTVTAANSYGSSPTATKSITVLSTPAALTIASVSSVDSSHSQVSWVLGSDNGSSIKWTTVKVFNVGTSFEVTNCLVSTTATSCLVTLPSGHFYDYDYAGFSTNSLGDGPLSIRYHLTVSRPAAPTALQATPTNTSFSVQFTPGSSGNLPITSYQYSQNAGSSWITFVPIANSLTVTTGVTSQTAYSIIIRALNDFGVGDTSTVVTFTTAADPVSAPVVVTPVIPITPVIVIPVTPVTPVTPVIPALPVCDAACEKVKLDLAAAQAARDQAVKDQAARDLAAKVQAAREQAARVAALAAATKLAINEATTQIPTSLIAPTVDVMSSVSPIGIEIISGSDSGVIKSISDSSQDYIPAGAVLALHKKLKFASTVGTISFAPTNGFTGRLVVPVVTFESGTATVVFHNVIVDPTAVIGGKFAPTSPTTSTIAWNPSPSDVTKYNVSINGVQACTTTKTSCVISSLIGPKTIISIQAVGNDQTFSTISQVSYAATAPLKVASLHFTTSSSQLNAREIQQLKAITQVVKDQGFTRVVCVGYTDSSGSGPINKTLSIARAKVLAAYLRTILKNVTITIQGMGSANPTASNKNAPGRTINRRSDFLTW